jgi:polyhydroxybutyrate depolymerase
MLNEAARGWATAWQSTPSASSRRRASLMSGYAPSDYDAGVPARRGRPWRLVVFWISLLFLTGIGLKTVRQFRSHAEASTVNRDVEHRLQHGDRERFYYVHVPASYDGSKPLPVVLNLHGGGGNADAARRQSRMNEVADRNGFIVVYPEGSGRLRHKLLTWNAGSCCAYAVDQQIDDVGFIRALLDDLPQHYRVDSRRVYATGISNGAMMCYRLACELPNRITAIGPVAGTLGVDGPVPSRGVPLIHFHGLQDRNVPYQGGFGPNGLLKVDHRSVPDTISFWCRVNHCDPTHPSVDAQDDVIIERFEPRADAKGGAPIQLYKLVGGGHTWPGGSDITSGLGTGKLVTSVDASQTMWDFFRQFALPENADSDR